jgi:hypothetical protein
MTVKRTIVFDDAADFLLRQVAARTGIATSAWLCAVTRHEALRTGAAPQPDAEQHCRYDEQELLAAEGAA